MLHSLPIRYHYIFPENLQTDFEKELHHIYENATEKCFRFHPVELHSAQHMHYQNIHVEVQPPRHILYNLRFRFQKKKEIFHHQ